MTDAGIDRPECWPALPLESWKDTCATLHMWTQIVGKVRLALTPRLNHWWNVPLYVAAHGLSTSRIPYGQGGFELRFDFVKHELVLETNAGAVHAITLQPQTVADLYQQFLKLLREGGIAVKIWKMPVEIANPIPFDQDRVHGAYDRAAVEKFWRILQTVDAVLQEFRARFVGKCSPVHFFWGSFDLAVTRFSGRPAPERPGADPVTREAYSQEVSSVGFWPGSGTVSDPAFYSYMAPAPQGFSEAKVRPPAAFYDKNLGEFLLMYDEVRRSAEPQTRLLEFCQSTYEAGANLAHWDRAALERWAANSN
jgi:hypothetical protein